MSTSTRLAYMLALASGTTTGVITIVITIVIMVVADGIHIMAADRVGPSRVVSAGPIEDQLVRVGDTVKHRWYR